MQPPPIVTEPIPNADDLQQQLHDGTWCTALLHAEDAIASGQDGARATARMAFVLSHAAWLRAAGLPPWLAAYDLRRRERLFGDLLEPGDGTGESMRRLLAGDAAAWQDLAEPEGETGVAPLLNLGEGTVPERIASLQAFALLLPLYLPEHWVSRTI